MSISVWPVISADELKKEEDLSIERELAWLLDSLQETLVSLKSGLEDCYALLAPIEPGSTLVMSSPRSESLKGHVTRVGTQIVKGSLHLRLKTHAPLHLVLSPTSTLPLQPLVSLRTLLNESLDCIDVTRWTGDKNSASFISGQLRLLHSILTEAKNQLKGPNLLVPNGGHDPETSWHTSPLAAEAFDPPLPSQVSLNLTISDASLIMTIRVLEPANVTPNLGTRLAFAIGAQRRLEHDEMDETFKYNGAEVRVLEKLRVESADPSLMAAMAKLAALEHTVQLARNCLVAVMGGDDTDLE
ncbi:hypothetical protein BP5796_11288 [Coleophoma crateriformis]|uniref:RAVE subunit 2/Rogdi n=1 Tax=Coleophoma crateriformis TaxID=565419 RepID=A0A3D8QHS7_9HELO|nr:hypothetical protein BP5796_11288 [Coleophoma crateriformis]